MDTLPRRSEVGLKKVGKLAWWATTVLCAALTSCVWAQTTQPQAKPPAAAQSTAQSAAGQQPLSVDRDPVPSPDPERKMVPTPEAAQTAGEITKQNGQYTLRRNAYEVRLNASVIDDHGDPVENLPQDAFHVYEDGVLQTIIGFRHEDVPVSMGILIDSSGSMYDKRAAVDAASLDLVRLSNPQDEAFLVDFSSEAYIDQDFTNDINKLQQGLAYIKSSGGTALYDAVIASADYLAKNAKRSKQVLLIVTDGDDNASSATLEQTIRRVQDLDGPQIYCIGLLFGEDVSRSDARHSKEVLTELAAETGGEAYFPRSLKEVDGITREVAQDIRSQYTIEYRSTKSPELGGYRQIHVEAKQKGYHGLQVRTRSGYFPKVAGAGGSSAGASGTQGK
jgi:VWFA-related protein